MADVREIIANVTGTNVTVSTTTETVAVASGKLKAQRPLQRVLVIAFAQMTIGAGGATVTPRIQRTDDVAGTVVDEGNAMTVTAGATELVLMMADDELSNVGDVEYNLSVAVASATADSTVLQAGILVMLVD